MNNYKYYRTQLDDCFDLTYLMMTLDTKYYCKKRYTLSDLIDFSVEFYNLCVDYFGDDVDLNSTALSNACNDFLVDNSFYFHKFSQYIYEKKNIKK